MAKKEQRIKLRIEGSPVKYDGSIIESTPDGKRIKVRFDGPLDDVVLHAYGEHKLVSDMRDSGGAPVTDVKLSASCQWWVVVS